MLKVLLVGHGFYALGTESGLGGTIIAGLLRWLSSEKQASARLTILARDRESASRAAGKVRLLLSNVQTLEVASKLEVVVLEEGNLGSLEFDVGIIATPEHAHMKYVRLLSGIAERILCVKPFGISASETEQALEIEKSSGVEIYIELHKRFDLANQQFVSVVRENLAGDCWFGFRYGQKSSVPQDVFRKWAHKSNPFQYLAPHYLDLIFLALQITPYEAERLKISGNVEALRVESQPNLVGLVSASLGVETQGRKVIIEATCNWMEPEATPFPSRQEIEFQSASAHLYSRQDNRGQRFYTQENVVEPNPQFHIQDEQFFAAGYGPESVVAFLSGHVGVGDRKLARLQEYLPTARVIDYVNQEISRAR